MIYFGIEYITKFTNYNKTAKDPVNEIYQMISIGDGLDAGLEKYKHTRQFHKFETDCAEIDIRDVSFKGYDNYFADNVDLFFIGTHGNNYEGIIELLYNTKSGGDWIAYSDKWKLGDKKLRWLLMFACITLDLSYILKLLPIFQKLHVICGAYDHMHAARSENDFGEDLADNLCEDDKPVADAWFAAASSGRKDNHPMVVAAENKNSIEVTTGRANWNLTTIARDRLSAPVPDIQNSDIYWLSVKWVEEKELMQVKQRVKTSR